MQVRRDLLDQKLQASKWVLPALFAESLPEQHEAGFEKLAGDPLEQCQAEERAYVLAESANIRQQVKLLTQKGTGGPV